MAIITLSCLQKEEGEGEEDKEEEEKENEEEEEEEKKEKEEKEEDKSNSRKGNMKLGWGCIRGNMKGIEGGNGKHIGS